MSKYDVVVFGATGHTGKRVVEELARNNKLYAGITWAIAGRSQKKLEDLLKEVSNKTGVDVTSHVTIVADVGDYESLRAMCGGARVVASCCGPYRHHGEPVLRAAIEARAHYVDVSGEPQFIESMQLKYDAEAREAGVFVVSACGFDSVPNDMGVVFLEQQFRGTLNAVESYLSVNMGQSSMLESMRSGCINYGTWESLIYSLAHHGDLRTLRKKLYPTKLPSFEPKLKSRFAVHRYGSGWCVPFLGADSSIVYRTQRRLFEADGKRPVQFRAYVRLTYLLTVIVMMIFGAIIMVMSKFEATRRFLLVHPRICSMGLVTRSPPQEINEGSRAQFRLKGVGWAEGTDAKGPLDKTVIAKVSMVDPGYGFTALALMQSALVILKERNSMPEQGGVYTTGAAFYKTNLITNLQDSDPNVKFEIIETLPRVED